ncbi:hypothetical protein E2562_039325, partial [Oryza meyeriana var. granulata]
GSENGDGPAGQEEARRVNGPLVRGWPCRALVQWLLERLSMRQATGKDGGRLGMRRGEAGETDAGSMAVAGDGHGRVGS